MRTSVSADAVGTMPWRLRACPRCQGALCNEWGWPRPEWQCLQCGYRAVVPFPQVVAEQELRLLGLLPMKRRGRKAKSDGG